MFSSSNGFIIFVITDCFFVKMTSYFQKPNLTLKLRADIVLKSVMTLITNFSSVKIVLHCFLDLSCSPYLCFI